MTIYDTAYGDGLSFKDTYGGTGYGVVNRDRLGLNAAYGLTAFGHTQGFGLGFHTSYFGYSFLPGALLADTLGFHDTPAIQSFLGAILRQGVGFDDAWTHAVPAAIMDALGLGAVLTLARAVTILQRLGLHEALAPNTRQGLAIAEALVFNDDILRFFGASFADVLKFHATIGGQAQFARSLTSSMSLHAALQGSLYWRVTLTEDMEIEDADLVNMLYQGDTLADGIEFSIATVDPGGGFTTWAINTRTGAVSEYQNFAYNSYCQIGNQFYGANADGFWLLNGPTDNGENIIADIKGGLLNIGGARFTQLDGVYLGINANSTGDEWVLKLILPNNKQPDIVYTYYFSPRDLQTTKINIGKGLRTRYMQWELVVPGQDFDLDAIEFVPVVAKRRV